MADALLCSFALDLSSQRWRCQNAGCTASYRVDRFPSPPPRQCGQIKGRGGNGPASSNLQSQIAGPTSDPPYLVKLETLILNGKATRSAVEIERVLSICRSNRCGQWVSYGCRQWCGCGRSTPHLFAAFLANAEHACGYWPAGSDH